jgi:hypothetical protein
MRKFFALVFVGSWYCLWYITKYSALHFYGEVVLFVEVRKCSALMFCGELELRGKALASDLESGQNHCRYYFLTSRPGCGASQFQACFRHHVRTAVSFVFSSHIFL